MRRLARQGVLEPLERLLASGRDREIRLQAISLLRASGRHAVLPALRGVLRRREDPVVRESALRAVVRIDSRGAFDDLVGILEADPRDALRGAALSLMARTRCAEAHRWLIRHWPSGNDPGDRLVIALALFKLRHFDPAATSRRISQLAEFAGDAQRASFALIEAELRQPTGSLHGCGR